MHLRSLVVCRERHEPVGEAVGQGTLRHGERVVAWRGKACSWLTWLSFRALSHPLSLSLSSVRQEALESKMEDIPSMSGKEGGEVGQEAMAIAKVAPSRFKTADAFLAQLCRAKVRQTAGWGRAVPLARPT